MDSVYSHGICRQIPRGITLCLLTKSSGKLDKGAVMKAICSGFQETTDPPVCLSEGEFWPIQLES